MPTSPFTSSADIREFYDMMIEEDVDTLISTTDVQISCLYKNQPLNFSQKKLLPPSQSLEPIKAYSCGMMAWNSEKFKDNMDRFGSAYHGGDGKN